MRIAFVTSEYISESNFSGGLANYLYQISQALVVAGHHPEIFTTSDIDEITVHDSVIVHRIKIINHDWLDQSRVLNEYLAKINEVVPFDIIQYSSWMGVGYHRLPNIPSVVRISSFNPLLESDTQSPNNDTELTSIKNCDAIYCPSKIIAQEVSKYTTKPIEIIETPINIDQSAFDHSIYNDNLQDKRYLLFFGRLTSLKGIDTISEIIYQLLAANPNLYFVFIGDGSVDSVKTAAREFTDKIIYFPALRHPQLFPIIKHSVAVVLPSKVDNFPNSCIESMAQEKVVIGTKGASFEQLITDGYNGYLIEIGNSSQLLDKITRVLNMADSQRSEIGKNATQSIKRLEPKKIVEQLIKFYQHVINKH